LKVAYCILPFLLLALLATPVSAWTSGSTTGEWVLADRDHFIRNGTGVSGHAEWNAPVDAFNGYWFMLNNVTWKNYREWHQFSTINDFDIKINITSSTGSMLVITHLHGATDIFGLLNTFHVSVGASCNATSWDQVSLTTPTFAAYGWDLTGWNPEEFQLFIIPQSDKTQLTWVWNVNGKNVAYTMYCNSVLSGATAAVTLIYEHKGDGYAEGYVADSFTLPSLPPYEDFKTGVAGWISEVLGIDLSQAAAILTSIVVLFFAVVRMTIPLLGAIVFLWIMDTIFTAVTTGEVRLIGDMFLRIYEMLMAIWRTLVGIIETIWDLITFWS
jgi:hypothetical protein